MGPPAQKILIIHAGGIGDLLLARPALRIFRQTFPHSSLALMGRPERLSLVAFDLRADSVHSVDQAGMAYFYLEGEALPAKLFSFFSSFAAVLTFGRENEKILAENLRRAGVEKVIALPPFTGEECKTHVSDYLIESLKAAGIEGENSFSPLRLPDEALTFARSFLAGLGFKEEERILAIHPGSGSPAKNWAAKNFARVGDWASERFRVLLISGPALDGLEEVKKAMKQAVPAADNLPLGHLAAVLEMSAVYLGNDSGITHLAASLGLPTVAVFGPTNPAVWGPRGPGVRIFCAKNLCSPCSPEVRSTCSRHCLQAIEPDSVIEVLAPFLA